MAEHNAENAQSNGPNLAARHRATFVRHLDLPRHKWEPSTATEWPWSHEPRHRTPPASPTQDGAA